MALFAAIALAACSDPQSTGVDAAVDAAASACKPTSPRSVPVSVFVTPDDGEKPYIDTINAASKNLRVFAYLMGEGGILDGLKKRAGQGVDVRVILDVRNSSNQKYRDELVGAGVKVLWSDTQFTHMHAKVIIADDVEAIVSTGNYSYYYAINRNRDYLARVADPQDLEDLIAIFEADWKLANPDLSCTRLLVSPVNSKQRLLELVNSAQSSLDIASMQLAETDTRAAVIARAKGGVKVRALLADPSWVDANQAAAAALKGASIPVRYLKTPGMHAKLLLVDSKWAYLGSINLSYTSMTKNREVGLLTSATAALQRLSATFNQDWSQATPF